MDSKHPNPLVQNIGWIFIFKNISPKLARKFFINVCVAWQFDVTTLENVFNIVYFDRKYLLDSIKIKSLCLLVILFFLVKLNGLVQSYHG